MKLYCAYYRIDNGAMAYARRCLVKAENEEQAKDIVIHNHCIEYDTSCEILGIQEYDFAFGSVVELR